MLKHNNNSKKKKKSNADIKSIENLQSKQSVLQQLSTLTLHIKAHVKIKVIINEVIFNEVILKFCFSHQ